MERTDLTGQFRDSFREPGNGVGLHYPVGSESLNDPVVGAVGTEHPEEKPPKDHGAEYRQQEHADFLEACDGDRREPFTRARWLHAGEYTTSPGELATRARKFSWIVARPVSVPCRLCVVPSEPRIPVPFLAAILRATY